MTYDVAIEISNPRGKTSADIFEVSLLSNNLDVKDDSQKTDRLAQIMVWWGIYSRVGYGSLKSVIVTAY